MKLIIDGKINSYYIQTLCLLFFPGAKFSENEIVTETTPVLYVRLESEYGHANATATLTVGKKSLTKNFSLPYSAEYTDKKTENITVSRAIFSVCELFFGYAPAWGILTGVRPAKVAYDYLASGKNVDEVKKILQNEYLVFPKKAKLAADIAHHEAAMLSSYDKNTCSLYISIPFCPSRCSYCSFVSYTTKKLLGLIPDYILHLKEELDFTLAKIKSLGLRLCTVYIGGGTPTTLSAEQLKELLSFIVSRCDPASLEEFTLEAGRPDTVTKEKLEIAKAHGVTRISVNPQTLDSAVLERVSRRHTVEMFYRAYEMAKASGIRCINTDLIAGLPADTLTGFSKTMDAVIALAPENITVHTFCVKRAADILKEKDVYAARDYEVGKCVDYAQLAAKKAKYFPYYIYRQKNTVGNFENVGFCKKNMEGLYNILMMEEIHTIFSVGAGAVTKLVSADREKIERIFNPKYPYEYLQQNRKEIFLQTEKIIDAFYEQNIR